MLDPTVFAMIADRTTRGYDSATIMRALGIHRVAAFYAIMGGLALIALIAGEQHSALVPPNLPVALEAVLVGLAIGLLVVFVSRLALAWFEWARGLAHELRQMVGELSGREIAYVALLSGVGEELLFRGVLHPALGLWLGAAVFGLLHVGPSRATRPWPLMAFAVGLLFGWSYDHTGSLWTPVLAHFVINYLNLRHLALVPKVDEVSLDPVGGNSAVM